MALEKKYDATPLQVLTDTQTREEIRALSKALGLSQAELMRQMIVHAIPVFQERAGGVGGI